MTNIPGVDFYKGDWDDGITNLTGLSDMADRGVQFFIAKVGQADWYDSRWDEHKAKLNALVQPHLKGAYWFLERAFPSGDPPGYFYPPLPRGERFIPSSYGKGYLLPVTPNGHNDFAVDFNREGGGDEGLAVRAIADGVVAAGNLAWDDAPPHFFTDGSWQGTYGTRFIDHVGGWRSQYTHMKNIIVSAGDTVVRGQKIGEISSHGAGTVGPAYAHLHHVQYRKTGTGPYVPVKMRFFGDHYVGASRAGTFTTKFTPDNRWTSPIIVGPRLPTGAPDPAYTGTTQANLFLAGLNASHDPSGWLCAVDFESPPTAEYGLSPGWPQLRQFADEFWRQAPGYPLFLYTSKHFWGLLAPGQNAKAYGFAGLWSADYTQIGSVYASQFAEKTAGLTFSPTSAHPYAAGYAGFPTATILQYGPLKVYANGGTKALDGNAYPGTLASLRALATGLTGPGPDPGDVIVPYVIGEEEDAALDELAAAGLVAGSRTTDNDPVIIEGRVISTDPAAGDTVATGSAVDYVVSDGPVAPGGSLDPSPMIPCGEV